MQNNRIIAAIDIGSSEIVGILGSLSSNNTLTVIAVERENSVHAIKRGLVHNLGETIIRLRRIVERFNILLEGEDVEIKRVYVGLGGQSVHTITRSFQKKFTADEIITESLLGQLENETLMSDFRPYEPFEIIPTEYRLNGISEPKPIGLSCRQIEVKSVVLVGRSSIKRDIERCFRELGVEVAGFIVSPLALSNLILTDEEKQLGCAQIDFGGNTTTLAVFRKGYLRKVVTVPFGGNCITRDIASLNLLEPQAEAIKKAVANATFDRTIENRKISVPDAQDSGMTVMQHEVDLLTEARVDEILENLLVQLNDSEMEAPLPAGIIVSGGAARQRGLTEALQRKSKLKVKFAAPIQSFHNQTQEHTSDLSWLMALGLVLAGKINCACEKPKPIPVVEEPVVEPQPAVKRETKKKPEQRGKNLFDFLQKLVGEDGQEMQ